MDKMTNPRETKRPLLGKITGIEAKRHRAQMPAADYAAQRRNLVTRSSKTGQHRSKGA
jgi:hypothetical protein